VPREILAVMRALLFFAAIASSVTASSVTAPSVAAACSPPLDAGMCSPATPRPVPDADAIDVPLNVEVDLAWLTSTYIVGGHVRITPSTTFRLRAADGELVELAPSPATLRARPTADLRPDTRYAIEDLDYGEPTGPGCAPRPEYVEIAAFTTSAVRDDDAPEAPAEAQVDACCYYAGCASGGCCGPYELVGRGIQFDVEPGAIVEYRVDGRGRVFGTGGASVGFFTEGMFGYPGGRPLLQAEPDETRAVEARAIDPAGNTSAWSLVISVPGCAPTRWPDGGVGGIGTGWTDSCVDGPGVEDAGPTGMDAALPSPMDGGVSAEPSHARACSASRGRSGPGLIGLLSLLVLAIVSVRRALAREVEAT